MMNGRNEIAHASGIENFAFRSPGLKAPNTTAQGNALGMFAAIISSPERAAQNSRDRFVVPLQGTSFCGFVTQGVALGYHVIAPSAREADGNLLEKETRLIVKAMVGLMNIACKHAGVV